MSLHHSGHESVDNIGIGENKSEVFLLPFFSHDAPSLTHISSYFNSYFCSSIPATRQAPASICVSFKQIA